ARLLHAAIGPWMDAREVALDGRSQITRFAQVLVLLHVRHDEGQRVASRDLALRLEPDRVVLHLLYSPGVLRTRLRQEVRLESRCRARSRPSRTRCIHVDGEEKVALHLDGDTYAVGPRAQRISRSRHDHVTPALFPPTQHQPPYGERDVLLVAQTGGSGER